MKIIRYIGADGVVQYAGAAAGSEQYLEMGTDLFGLEPSDRPANIHKLLAPLVPTQILCIGLNYRKHATESGLPFPEYPVLFVKGVNALQNPGDPIVLPRFLVSDQVDYECELAVVIGKRCKNVLVSEALDYVLGYTCANDVSSRDWQIAKGGGQWCKGKFFDSFAPLGPCLVTADEIRDPNNLAIYTVLNGEKVQNGNTKDMIFSVAQLIAFLSASCTLEPGTVILTGTPEGVGMSFDPKKYLKAADVVTIGIEGIGELSNPVIEEQTSLSSIFNH